MLTIRKLPDHPIWHVESDDRWELAMTFLRIEEYYECPNPRFQGNIFSLEAYMDWYVQDYSKKSSTYGAFTYAYDWSAFNVPSRAVRAVYETFPAHSAKETVLFDALREQGAFALEQFYVIGNKRGANAYFAHEYRHALFALNDSYRDEMRTVITQFAIPELRKWILSCYAPSVLEDEIQAYALTGWPGDVDITSEMRKLKRALKIIEKKYITAS